MAGMEEIPYQSPITPPCRQDAKPYFLESEANSSFSRLLRHRHTWRLGSGRGAFAIDA